MKAYTPKHFVTKFLRKPYKKLKSFLDNKKIRVEKFVQIRGESWEGPWKTNEI